jgi:hypothetical protein
MTDSRKHPTFDEWCDYVDGVLAPAARATIASHLATCSDCAERVAKLDALVTSARDLQIDSDPPSQLWNGIHDRITKVAALGNGAPQRTWRLAAAAIALVALSSGITLLVVRREPMVAERPSATPVPRASLVSPARRVDADYANAISELNETLAQRRMDLDPATVAKIETSLRVIDLAIAEARHALEADPADRDLVDLLAASYERKVELLRRANQLPPST